MFVAIPFDQQMTDTYFVVAHFHYIIFGAAVFPIFGGMYYWFPKVTGPHVLRAARARSASGSSSSGRTCSFFPMHIVGLLGMPRRVYTYPGGLGWTSTTCSSRSAASSRSAGILLLLGEPRRLVPPRRARPAPTRGTAPTLEWTIPSPPPEYNFAVIPTVTSAYPNWDAPTASATAAPHRAASACSTTGTSSRCRRRSTAHLDEIVDMPHGVAVADPRSRSALSAVFAVLMIDEVHRRGGLRRARRADAARLALEGAAGGMSDRARSTPTRAPHAARRPAWWGMAMFVATEATLFAMHDRLVLLSALQERAVAAAGHPGAEGRSCRSSCSACSSRRASRCSSRARAGRDGRLRRRAWLLCSRSSCRSGYFAMAGARLPGRPAATSRRATTRTARSTTCCSAPTTPTSRVGLLFNAMAARAKLARGLTDLPAERAAGDRVLLARRQRRSRSS